MPYPSASEVMIHEEALYQVYVSLPFYLYQHDRLWVAGAMEVRRAMTSGPSHMTSGPTPADLHPVYPSQHAANPSAAAAASEPQTAFRPIAKRSVVACNTFGFVAFPY